MNERACSLCGELVSSGGHHEAGDCLWSLRQQRDVNQARLAHLARCLRTVLRAQDHGQPGTVNWAFWLESCPELREEA